MKDLLDSMASKGRAALDDDSVYARYKALPPDAKRLADVMAERGRAALDNDSVYNVYTKLTKAQAPAAAVLGGIDSTEMQRRAAPPKPAQKPFVSTLKQGLADVGRRSIAVADRTSARPTEDHEAGRFSKALMPRTTGSNALGLLFDLPTVPGRALASLPALLDSNPTTDFITEMARVGPADESPMYEGKLVKSQAAQRLSDDILRAPETALLPLLGALGLGAKASSTMFKGAKAARSGAAIDEALSVLPSLPAGKALLHARELGEIASKSAPLLERAATSAVQGGIDVGLPLAGINLAEDLFSGKELGSDNALSALYDVGVGTALGPAGELIGTGAKAAVSGLAPYARKVSEKVSPLLKSAAEYAVNTKVGDVSSDVLEALLSGAGNSTGDALIPGILKSQANDWFRRQVKPGPMIKKGQEMADFLEALDEGMLPKIASYRDMFGTAGSAGERTMAKIEDLNRGWDPRMKRVDEAAKKLEDIIGTEPNMIVIGGRSYTPEEIAAAGGPEAIGAMQADVMRAAARSKYEPLRPGVSTDELRRVVSNDLLDNVGSGRTFASADEAKNAIDWVMERMNVPTTREGLQQLIAGAPVSAAERLPVSVAHARKSGAFDEAWKKPEHETARSAAALAAGRGVNSILDDQLAKLSEGARLPVPSLRTLEFAPGAEHMTLKDLSPAMTKHLEDVQDLYLKGGLGNTGMQMGAMKAVGDVNSMTDDALATYLNQTKKALRDNQYDVAVSNHVNARLDDWKMRNPKATPKQIQKKRAELQEGFRYLKDAGADAGVAADAELLSSINTKADQLGDDYINLVKGNFQGAMRKYVQDLKKYKVGSEEYNKALRAVREFDKTMRQWYKVEPAMKRAMNSRGNNNKLGLLELVGGGVGGIAGLGLNDYTDYDDGSAWAGAVNPVIGALLGAGAFHTLKSPAGPRGLYDVGRGGQGVSQGLMKSASKVGPLMGLDAVLRDLNKVSGYDRVEPDTSSVKYADKQKKGGR